METSGSIELDNGNVFMWMRGSGDGEVHGVVRRPEGGFVPGTSGWYRTTNPAEAAKVASVRVSQS